MRQVEALGAELDMQTSRGQRQTIQVEKFSQVEVEHTSWLMRLQGINILARCLKFLDI